MLNLTSRTIYLSLGNGVKYIIILKVLTQSGKYSICNLPALEVDKTLIVKAQLYTSFML
ncbi:hypothetical protein [Flavimarina sp. Hel_I_48]|uniref:hypothetical protein n=1 Tax=Flavimarina sp. Hel_I_48 TaxID=1392488 RepID=UPI0013DAC967|nr:hypothetical protein [Flavimarina sp. Hel_I_48]